MCRPSCFNGYDSAAAKARLLYASGGSWDTAGLSCLPYALDYQFKSQS